MSYTELVKRSSNLWSKLTSDLQVYFYIVLSQNVLYGYTISRNTMSFVNNFIRKKKKESECLIYNMGPEKL